MREVTVGLLGHSISSANLGVGALTISNIAIAEGVARELGVMVKFRLLGSLDTGHPYVRGANVETIPLRTRSYIAPRNGLPTAVRQCDLVLDITGGDSFADIYGTARFVRLSLAKAVVIAARRPLILSPQTIGPFRHSWTRWMAIQLMRKSRAVITRDRLTTEFLAPFRLGPKLIEATDVAFRLPFERPARSADGQTRVGLNVSGLLFNGGYTQNNMFGLATNYPELARGLLHAFSRQRNCEIHLISHVVSDKHAVEDDYRVAEQLAGEFPAAVVAPRFAGPIEAKSYISGMDFFAGSRMHACIAALSSGVPLLPLAYSRKFAGVFGTLGYAVVADCGSETAEAIIRKTIDVYSARDALRPMIDAARTEAEGRLCIYEAVMRECFREIMGVKHGSPSGEIACEGPNRGQLASGAKPV